MKLENITIGTLLQEHDTTAESHLGDKIEKLGKIISLGHLADTLATNIIEMIKQRVE